MFRVLERGPYPTLQKKAGIPTILYGTPNLKSVHLRSELTLDQPRLTQSEKGSSSLVNTCMNPPPPSPNPPWTCMACLHPQTTFRPDATFHTENKYLGFLAGRVPPYLDP